MEYLATAILQLIGLIASGIVEFFTGDFWENLTIVEVVKPEGKGWKFGGYFDDFLPGVASLKTAFVVIAGTFILLLLMVELVRAFFPDTQNSKAVHPIQSLARAAGATFCVANAYSLMAIIQLPMAALCQGIYNLPEERETLAREFGVINTINFDHGSELITLFLSTLMLAVVVWAFIKLILEMVERYVTLGFLWYAAPLAFCTFTSESTAGVCKSYFRMLFSQYLLIMLNFCVLFVFCYAFANQPDLTGEGGAATAIIYYAVMLAWLRLGQRLDEHLSSLGLSVANTGAGLGSEIFGGLMAAGLAIKGAGAGIKLGRAGANKFSPQGGTEKYGKFDAQGMPKDAANALNKRIFGAQKGDAAKNSAADVLGLNKEDIKNAQVHDGAIDMQDRAGNDIHWQPSNVAQSTQDVMGIQTRGADGQMWTGVVGGAGNVNSDTIRSAVNHNGVIQELKKGNNPVTVDGTGQYQVTEGIGKSYYANTQLYKPSEQAAQYGQVKTVKIGGQEFYKYNTAYGAPQLKRTANISFPNQNSLWRFW